ncbi:unnamed protein product [Schistosoma margrebowiei]|uniref:Uncharacterized protein n=1 Tax=Schistosoma margrebowiei TaxID=48269 RepID=A0A183LZ65_9TREM|nr:unnamed protein product [Schistosoma margrebowiei]
MKVAHQGVTFPCDECSKIFSSNGALCRHLQSVHQGNDFFDSIFICKFFSGFNVVILPCSLILFVFYYIFSTLLPYDLRMYSIIQ